MGKLLRYETVVLDQYNEYKLTYKTYELRETMFIGGIFALMAAIVCVAALYLHDTSLLASLICSIPVCIVIWTIFVTYITLIVWYEYAMVEYGYGNIIYDYTGIDLMYFYRMRKRYAIYMTKKGIKRIEL